MTINDGHWVIKHWDTGRHLFPWDHGKHETEIKIRNDTEKDNWSRWKLHLPHHEIITGSEPVGDIFENIHWKSNGTSKFDIDGLTINNNTDYEQTQTTKVTTTETKVRRIEFETTDTQKTFWNVNTEINGGFTPGTVGGFGLNVKISGGGGGENTHVERNFNGITISTTSQREVTFPLRCPPRQGVKAQIIRKEEYCDDLEFDSVVYFKAKADRVRESNEAHWDWLDFDGVKAIMMHNGIPGDQIHWHDGQTAKSTIRAKTKLVIHTEEISIDQYDL